MIAWVNPTHIFMLVTACVLSAYANAGSKCKNALECRQKGLLHTDCPILTTTHRHTNCDGFLQIHLRSLVCQIYWPGIERLDLSGDVD